MDTQKTKSLNTDDKKVKFQILSSFDKQIIALELYTVKMLTLSEISEILDVDKKTMGAWVKKYKWKEIKDHNLHEKLSPEIVTIDYQQKVLTDFLSFVKTTNSYQAKKLEHLLKIYLEYVRQSNNEQFNSRLEKAGQTLKNPK